MGRVVEVLLRNPHVWLMTDELYEHLIYTGSVPKKVLVQMRSCGRLPPFVNHRQVDGEEASAHG